MKKEKDLTKMPVYKFDESYGLPIGIKAEIEIVKFDKEYYKLYFDENDGACNSLKKPKGLRQGPEWIETEIINIREKNNPNAIDIFKILAWKAGKIDIKKSNEIKKIEYVDNWKEKSSFQMPNQPVVSWDEFTQFANDISAIWSNYREQKINVSFAWKTLVKLATDTHKETMKGIGTVILVTLLFFITKGEYPIYDRFAMSSLVIWNLNQQGINTPTGTIIRGCGLPSKEKPEELNELLCSGKYYDYIQLLKQFCSKEYGEEDIWKDKRYVDQALYVYGHFYDARY